MQAMRRTILENIQHCEETRETAEMTELRTQLWVVDGFLQHRISLQMLQSVANKYTALKLVPECYHQAELWSSEHQPAYYNLQRPEF